MQKNNSRPETIDTALVVGAGIMGHGFAQLLAMNNIEVIPSKYAGQSYIDLVMKFLTYLSVFEYLAEKLGKAHFKPPELLKKQVKAGKLGLKA